MGPAAGLVYILAADALWHGQSVGKRLAGVQVVHFIDGHVVGLAASLVRNIPMALALLLFLLPILSWLLFPVLGLPLLLLESILARRGERGRRMGDVLADTYVALKRSR